MPNRRLETRPRYFFFFKNDTNRRCQLDAGLFLVVPSMRKVVQGLVRVLPRMGELLAALAWLGYVFAALGMVSRQRSTSESVFLR